MRVVGARSLVFFGIVLGLFHRVRFCRELHLDVVWDARRRRRRRRSTTTTTTTKTKDKDQKTQKTKSPKDRLHTQIRAGA